MDLVNYGRLDLTVKIWASTIRVHKVSRPKMETFSSAPCSRKTWNTQLVWDDYQIQIVPIAIVLIIIRNSCELLCIIKVKTLMLPQIILTIEPRIVNMFKARSPIS